MATGSRTFTGLLDGFPARSTYAPVVLPKGHLKGHFGKPLFFATGDDDHHCGTIYNLW
jgi:hypothetical protein